MKSRIDRLRGDLTGIMGEHVIEGLVRLAMEGDREAWSLLLERYRERWLAKFHGDLDTTIRKLYDTEALVQSAIGDALRDAPQLKSEAAFYTWVTSIIRHKLANARRRLRREVALGDSIEPRSDATCGVPEQSSILDSYLSTLDAILELFSRYPEAMAAVVMRFQEGLSIQDMTQRFERPRSTVYRWLRDGVQLLQEKFKA